MCANFGYCHKGINFPSLPLTADLNADMTGVQETILEYDVKATFLVNIATRKIKAMSLMT